MADSKSGRKRGVALLLVGMVLGAALITPAGAHVTSVAHSWKKHFLPLAKKAFYTKTQSNAKYLGKTAKATDSLHADAADTATNATNATNADNAGTLDGIDSLGFYATGSKVADSETLDGINSTGFYTAGSTVANSNLVGGLAASSLNRLAGGSGNCATVTTGDAVCGTLTITAPVGGLVKVDGTMSYTSVDCTSACDLFMYLRRVGGATGGGHYGSLDLTAGQSYGSISASTVFAVPAGTNVFELRSNRNTGNGTISGLGSSLTATFSPFGGVGSASTSATSSRNAFGG